MAKAPIFSLGSSLHNWGSFEELLRASRIDLMIDVRSSPKSRLPHFNQALLARRLAEACVDYLYLGHQLGGRPADGGVADYEAMAREPAFIAGIDRVVSLAAQSRAALMCSEHEPLQCHRYLLVGQALSERGLEVRHVLRDGAVEDQRHTDDRLLSLHRQDRDDLLRTRKARLAEACRLQNRRLWAGMKRSRQGGSHAPNQG